MLSTNHGIPFVMIKCLRMIGTAHKAYDYAHSKHLNIILYRLNVAAICFLYLTYGEESTTMSASSSLAESTRVEVNNNLY